MSGDEQLFAGEREALVEAQRDMTPAQYANFITAYIENAHGKVVAATSEQLETELRYPSTCITNVSEIVMRESMARILKACAL